MARIGWIEESDATGELAEVYAEVRATWPPKEQAAEVFKALSHRPAFMKALSDATLMTITPGALSSPQHEMIALHVSVLTNCQYCAYHHRVFLEVGELGTASLPGAEDQGATRRRQIADALSCGDLESAPLTERERLMLRFVEALTLRPGTIPNQQIDGLRASGWVEAQIAEMVYTCALYNAWVRITNAFDTDPHDIDSTFGLGSVREIR